MQSLSQLAGGWAGALGGQPGFPQQNPQSAAFNAYAQQALQQFNATGAAISQQYPGGGGFVPAQYPPAQFPYGGVQQPVYGGGGFPYGGGGFVPQGTGQYGGTQYTGPGNFIPQGQQFNPTQPGFPGIPGRLMAYPTDPNDFASYLQAQRLGGALNGQTTIRQSDAIPGTRFGSVQNSQAWNASVARNYAYQFAAQAMGQDALSPQGLAFAAQNFDQMSPDAKLFTQVASVFKGNLLGGPGNYDNPGLKQLLQSRGLGNLANQPGVGETDVQTIGAITQALNSGQLSLQDVLASGTIDNMDRYQQIIGYVSGGAFNQDLSFFDTNAR
ncbi:MAG: hypothetical protein KF760_31645 [Candidatus Eremiobacteraeota bacterium]|nr:hypothetical protein [Candidatus Eremiobacteraeota bacterium]MCW5870028.1 hypothetical protein [Candidatus Eremiobacteraeota bacterium]